MSKKSDEINESTWIYTSEEFAPPGAPVGMPTSDFCCEVSVRPGCTFVMSASYVKPCFEPLGVWVFEHDPEKECGRLPYIVYAWRKDRRRPAPLANEYIDKRSLLRPIPEEECGDDPVYQEYVCRNRPENCFRPLTDMEAEYFEMTSTKRAELIILRRCEI